MSEGSARKRLLGPDDARATAGAAPSDADEADRIVDPQDTLEDEVFDLAHLVLDCLGQVGVVDQHAEFEVSVLRAP